MTLPPDSHSGATGAVSLGDAINTATRSAHARLNKLILARLPLALPPYASSASEAYLQGLLHIAPIYIAFEHAWDMAMEPSRSETHGFIRNSKKSQELKATCGRLSHIQLPELRRSWRARKDITNLTGWNSETLEKRLGSVTQGQLGAFINHIEHQSLVNRKPHLLVAYAWIFYMALFSGGKIVGAALEAACAKNPTFWDPKSLATRDQISASESDVPHDDIKTTGQADSSESSETSQTPLDFFRFSNPEAGEHAKRSFKRDIAMMNLTATQRDDVVAEAVYIFDSMIAIVGQLDKVCGTVLEGQDTASHWQDNQSDKDSNCSSNSSLLNRKPESSLEIPHSMFGRVGNRIRDSVAIAKERMAARTPQKEPPWWWRISGKMSTDAGANPKEHHHLLHHHQHHPQRNGGAGPETVGSLRFDRDMPVPDRSDQAQNAGLPQDDGAADDDFGIGIGVVVDLNAGGLGDKDLTSSVARFWSLMLLLGIFMVLLGFAKASGRGALP